MQMFSGLAEPLNKYQLEELRSFLGRIELTDMDKRKASCPILPVLLAMNIGDNADIILDVPFVRITIASS
jgi:hypothetical protein